jgi:integrase
MRHHRKAGPKRTVREAYEELLQSRRDKGSRENTTIKDIKRLLRPFVETYGDKAIQQISPEELSAWLRENSRSVRQRHKNRTQLSGLFNLALKNGYLITNPVARIPAPKLVKSGRTEILTVSETRALMASAENEKPEMVPYFALCLFAGIRPGHPDGEMGRLDWDDIDFKLREIYIRPEVAKRDIQDRVIRMSENLIAWLLPYRKERGPIYFTDYSRRRIIKNAGVRWVNSIMRHSFGSYHLGRYQNSGDTAEQMGHQGDKMLFKHYRRALSKSEDTDPGEFWAIFPDSRRAK